MDQAPFFIVGVGRSGTSLLQSILTSHSQICIPPETGFVRGQMLSKNVYRDKSAKEFLEINGKLKRVIKTIPDTWPQTFKDERDFYKYFLENYCVQKVIRGDKDPRLIEFMSATARLFPRAQFIHLVRDPRDVLLSKKKAAWSKEQPGWYHIFANYIQLKLGECVGRKWGGQRYKVVIYEDMLAHPAATAEELCTFLGVPFEQGMLEFQQKARELVADEEKQWKKETYGPLLKNNIGKWKDKLVDWEVALTEMLCRQAFTLGGYAKSEAYNKLPLFQKIRMTVMLCFFRGAGALYKIYRIGLQNRNVSRKYDLHTAPLSSGNP